MAFINWELLVIVGSMVIGICLIALIFSWAVSTRAGRDEQSDYSDVFRGVLRTLAWLAGGTISAYKTAEVLTVLIDKLG